MKRFCGFIKMRLFQPVSIFAKEHKKIVVATIGAVAYSLICIYFKCSPKYNVSHDVAIWGEFFIGVSMSIIAAFIFFIVQVYMPNYKRDSVLKAQAKKDIQEVILRQLKYLKQKLDMIENKEKKEPELYAAIANNCETIKEYIWNCINRYGNVLHAELLKSLLDIYNDDCFDMIDIKARGKLINHSIEGIINETFSYNLLWEKQRTLENEVEKLN